MALFPYFLAVAVLLSPLETLPGRPHPSPREDTEEELVTQIQRERNPVKRAKYEIRLGRVKLLQAIAAYDKADFAQCRQLLDAYWQQMNSAWETLRSSGRQAARQPAGFKELEIALREDARVLEDLKHRMPYDQRGAVEKVTRGVETLRDRVIRALFPAPVSQGAEKRWVSPPPAYISMEQVLGWNA